MTSITIPWGYKFKPEDHELIVCLACKADGVALPWPCEGLIREVDLFRLPDPGILFERSQGDVVYVFTKLKKVVENGKRFDRNVLGKLTWKGVDGGKPIHNPEGLLVGEKKNFVLMNTAKMKLGYNMTEFSLDKQRLRNSRFKDFVLCQIKKNDKKVRSFTDISKTSVSNEGDSVQAQQQCSLSISASSSTTAMLSGLRFTRTM